jgi:hypothetical protein
VTGNPGCFNTGQSVYSLAIEQKCIFEHDREIQTRKNVLNDIIFATKNIF